MITTVLHVTTGAEIIYTLSPKEAVVCAFEQFERNNYRADTYRFNMAKISLSGKNVSCGNCVAKIN